MNPEIKPRLRPFAFLPIGAALLDDFRGWKVRPSGEEHLPAYGRSVRLIHQRVVRFILALGISQAVEMRTSARFAETDESSAYAPIPRLDERMGLIPGVDLHFAIANDTIASDGKTSFCKGILSVQAKGHPVIETKVVVLGASSCFSTNARPGRRRQGRGNGGEMLEGDLGARCGGNQAPRTDVPARLHGLMKCRAA